jgi:hypothetical protein
VRKLAQAQRVSEAEQAEQAAQQQAEAVDRTADLYAIADTRFTALLPEFPHLLADDAHEVKQALHQKYVSLRQTQGEAGAINAAFNDESLRAVMAQMNTRLAKRLGAAPPSPPAPAAAGKAPLPDAAAAAAQHNARVAEKLERKDASRTMRGAGAPPIATETQKAPTSFAEGKVRIKSLFQKIGAT